MNLEMPELKACLEAEGLTGVRTLASSGNVVFEARTAGQAALERRLEAAMEKRLGRSFLTIVRPVEVLREILEADPFRAFRLPAGAKRVVTFLKDGGAAKVALPVERDGARILCRRGGEVYSAYVPGPKGPVFMALIEKTFGKAVTTRTWDAVRRVAR